MKHIKRMPERPEKTEGGSTEPPSEFFEKIV